MRLQPEGNQTPALTDSLKAQIVPVTVAPESTRSTGGKDAITHPTGLPVNSKRIQCRNDAICW